MAVSELQNMHEFLLVAILKQPSFFIAIVTYQRDPNIPHNFATFAPVEYFLAWSC